MDYLCDCIFRRRAAVSNKALELKYVINTSYKIMDIAGHVSWISKMFLGSEQTQR